MAGCASTPRNTCSWCVVRSAGRQKWKSLRWHSAPRRCWRGCCRRRWTGVAIRSRRSSWVPRSGTRGGNRELIDSRMFIPTKAFLTKGVGRHKEKLTSFEMALRDAHLANFNLVRVSSIFPPHCELDDREEGLSMLKPGQILFTVVAESSTNEPSRLIAASIGLALPADPSHRGNLVLAVAVVFGDVSVMGGVGGEREPDRRRDETARLVGGRLRDDGEQHLPGPQHAQPLFAIDKLAMRGKN